MTKTLFVDLDDTVLLPGRFSRTMWRLAKWFQRRGRALMRPNLPMIKAFRGYDKVILVTSRDASDTEETLRLLAEYNIHFSEVRFCPRRTLFEEWKIQVIDETAQDGNVDWIDNLFDKTGSKMISRTRMAGEIRALPVPRGNDFSDSSDSEPPSL